MTEYIYHFTRREDFEACQDLSSYTIPSVHKEGFIHCSREDQVARIANSLIPGKKGYVLLKINPTLVKAPIKHENLEGGEQLFPHIYGSLNQDAIVSVIPFEPDQDGMFHLPKS